MNKIKAIDTKHKGINYRSRLEARWSIFFDRLTIRFQYEYEGFELPTGRYLPDFDIGPGIFYFEVKGSLISDRELRLACELAEQSGRFVLIAHSGFTWSNRHNTYRPEVTLCMGMHRELREGDDFFNATGPATIPAFQHGLTLKPCFECRHIYACSDYKYMPCRMTSARTCHGKYDLRAEVRLQEAYRKAIGARFEFGDAIF